MKKVVMDKKVQLINRVGKWYLNKLIGKRTPLMASFFITNVCNFTCGFCNIAREKEKSRIGLEQFKNIIDSISPHVFYMSFSGGEPFLVPNLPEYFKYAKEKGVPFVHVVSNASVLTNEKIKQIDGYLDEISFSLDRFGEEHDKIRQFKGSFERLISAVERVKNKSSIKVSINTVLIPEYVEDYYKIVEYTIKNDINIKFQVLNIHPEFKGIESANTFVSEHKKISPKLGKFAEYLKKQKNVLNSKHYLNQIAPYFEGKIGGVRAKKHCSLPEYAIEFRSTGEITPCMNGSTWRTVPITENVIDTMNSYKYDLVAKNLKKCNFCKNNMYVCNVEPRIAFPLSNFIKYTLLEGTFFSAPN